MSKEAPGSKLAPRSCQRREVRAAVEVPRGQARSRLGRPFGDGLDGGGKLSASPDAEQAAAGEHMHCDQPPEQKALAHARRLTRRSATRARPSFWCRFCSMTHSSQNRYTSVLKSSEEVPSMRKSRRWDGRSFIPRNFLWSRRRPTTIRLRRRSQSVGFSAEQVFASLVARPSPAKRWES